MLTVRPRPGKSIGLYLQHPADGHWMQAGSLLVAPAEPSAQFRYTPDYLASPGALAIDPLHLPLGTAAYAAHRYDGLPDALRDMCPDAWGQRLLAGSLCQQPVFYPRLLLAGGQVDRWGALAVNSRPQGSFVFPALARARDVCAELLAIQRGAPALDQRLRRKLLMTPNLGGARPKATIGNDEGRWIVKPRLATDECDVPALEYLAARVGAACSMQFADSQYLPDAGGFSALLVKRFDHDGDRRHLVLSAASLLGVAYPALDAQDRRHANYGLLADALTSIGAPVEDARELYRRLAYNALIGNDDDHPRNHAVVYVTGERRWRLAPAYDVVPNSLCRPQSLAMGLDEEVTALSQAALLAIAPRFGFQTSTDGGAMLRALGFELCQALATGHFACPVASVDLFEAQLVQGLKMLDLWSDRHANTLTHRSRRSGAVEVC